jgi:hypothetical protein
MLASGGDAHHVGQAFDDVRDALHDEAHGLSGLGSGGGADPSVAQLSPVIGAP